MPRYIDAEKLEDWVNAFHLADAYWAIPMLRNAPTDDVVPKSELVNEITSHLAGLYDFFKQNDDIREAYAILFAIAELKKKYTEGEDKPASEEKHFSPEDVRNMTPQEVREKYTAIRKSMEKW